MTKTTADVLVVGGGIIGLTIARELIQKGYKNIVIIDKEKDLGKHASGRNSGVLHAGIYYPPDSLKARSCLNGNFLMRTYCKEKGLPILESGKVIVTRSEKEIATLKELYRRALANGAKVDMVNEQELNEIEEHRECIDAVKRNGRNYIAAVDHGQARAATGFSIVAADVDGDFAKRIVTRQGYSTQ